MMASAIELQESFFRPIVAPSKVLRATARCLMCSFVCSASFWQRSPTAHGIASCSGSRTLRASSIHAPTLATCERCVTSGMLTAKLCQSLANSALGKARENWRASKIAFWPRWGAERILFWLGACVVCCVPALHRSRSNCRFRGCRVVVMKSTFKVGLRSC